MAGSRQRRRQTASSPELTTRSRRRSILWTLPRIPRTLGLTDLVLLGTVAIVNVNTVPPVAGSAARRSRCGDWRSRRSSCPKRSPCWRCRADIPARAACTCGPAGISATSTGSSPAGATGPTTSSTSRAAGLSRRHRRVRRRRAHRGARGQSMVRRDDRVRVAGDHHRRQRARHGRRQVDQQRRRHRQCRHRRVARRWRPPWRGGRAWPRRRRWWRARRSTWRAVWA